MRLLRLCKTSHRNIHEKLPLKIKQRAERWPGETAHVQTQAREKLSICFAEVPASMVLTPPPTPDPLPGKWAEATDFFFFSDGHCAENHKVINEKYPFKMKSHGLMSDAVTGKQSGLRSLLRWEVCLQIGWVRPEMHFSHITTLPLSSDTKATFFFFFAREEIDMVPTVPKSIYGPEKCELSTARVRVPHS